MTQQEQAIQSFCARVISFCHNATDISIITMNRNHLEQQAKALEREANGIQDSYGGRKARTK